MGLSIICPEGRVSKVWGHVPFLGSKNGHLGNHNPRLISRKFHQGFQKCLTEEYQLSSLNLEASVVAFLNLRFLGLNLVLKLSSLAHFLVCLHSKLSSWRELTNSKVENSFVPHLLVLGCA